MPIGRADDLVAWPFGGTIYLKLACHRRSANAWFPASEPGLRHLKSKMSQIQKGRRAV
jgi:hypothetical protein